MAPILSSSVCRFVGFLLNSCGNFTGEEVVWRLAFETFIAGSLYFMYFGDDEAESCWLVFKPWIHKKQRAILQCHTSERNTRYSFEYPAQYLSKDEDVPDTPPPQYSSFDLTTQVQEHKDEIV